MRAAKPCYYQSAPAQAQEAALAVLAGTAAAAATFVEALATLGAAALDRVHSRGLHDVVATTRSARRTVGYTGPERIGHCRADQHHPTVGALIMHDRVAYATRHEPRPPHGIRLGGMAHTAPRSRVGHDQLDHGWAR